MKSQKSSLAKVPSKNVPVQKGEKWGQISKGAGVDQSTIVKGLKEDRKK